MVMLLEVADISIPAMQFLKKNGVLLIVCILLSLMRVSLISQAHFSCVSCLVMLLVLCSYGAFSVPFGLEEA